MVYNASFKQYELAVTIKKGVTRNALLWLPRDFEDLAVKKYPLLIVHPGSGEVSIANNNAGISNMVRNGIPKMIKDGWLPTAKNPNTGVQTDFIVLSIQQNSTGYIIPPESIKYAVENCSEIKDRYDHVFMTGLSLGGCATAAFYSIESFSFLDWVSGLIPMSAKPLTGVTYDSEMLKKVTVPVWQFCGKNDAVAFRNFFNLCQINIPGIESTFYDGAHDGWVIQYKNSRSKEGYNILEWCLSKIPVDFFSKIVGKKIKATNVVKNKTTEGFDRVFIELEDGLKFQLIPTMADTILVNIIS